MNQPLASPSLWKPTVDASTSETSSRKFGAYEIKFLIEEERAEALVSLVRQEMQVDAYADPTTGGYGVEGIYFETAERDVFRKSPGYSRRKFRIRRYSEGSTLFLERKSKRNGIVTKRRIALDASELANTIQALNSLNSMPEPTQALSLDWFARRITRRRLIPTICIRYNRMAFMQMDNCGPIRLTIDRNLGCTPFVGDRFPSKEEYDPILRGHCVLEFKFRDSLPLSFREWMERFQLMPQSVSKFRNAIGAAGLDLAVPSNDSSITQQGSPHA